MLWSKDRQITRLTRLAETRRIKAATETEYRKAAVNGQARMAQRQSALFQILAQHIKAGRHLGDRAGARAFADSLAELLDIEGFGAELEFALTRINATAGEPA